MKRICTICARGGSKGLPGKNVMPLLGKPLIAWSVEQAVQSGLFQYVAVSSDDDTILEAAETAGAKILIRRPSDLATDSAAKVPAILHALRTAEAQTNEIFDILVDLDATSPLRLVEDISGAIRLLESTGCTNVITGAKARRSPYFNLVERSPDGFINLSKPSQITRRQDAPAAFDMNASIYAWQRDAFNSTPKVFYDDTLLYEMPEDRSLDIDTPLDFKIVELILRERGGSNRQDAFSLEGKVAVVTGASGILGRYFCRSLAERGAIVAALDLKGTGEVADEMQRISGRSLGIDMDVSDPSSCMSAIERIEQTLGPVDILHNNAASKGPELARFFDPVETFSPEIWRDIMKVNIDGYFFMAQAVGPRMAKRGRGSIIQTCSIYGVVGPDQRIYEGSDYLGMPINTPAVYSASKAGVDGLTKYLATYWGKDGVRVNSLTPGGVESGQNKEFSRRYSARVPLGRMAAPSDIANALAYLASDASSYVTGHNLIVDGGLTAW
ncbi:short chain dehydrogenase [Agrobacterium albertimagni AOL15]|uniref:Short chain dehydrogenase n=1 Tax=Agrobacterium albertimagni AOL15 TaxID=1156935 RepID=K2PEN5_9HYPH|nr:SDR family oxidoreductase [Agrobacterium albertimagni]EKF59373.1 short chain dehydrogenase [Agrobacterium albertimagni AOL15]